MNQPSEPQPTNVSVTAPVQSPLRLRFRGGQYHGKVVRVNSPKCTIGSAEHATLRLSCPGVHPVHCLIMRGKSGTVVKSMSPDTLLNSEVFDDTQMNSGDVLSIGPIELEVLEDVAAQDQADTCAPQAAAALEALEAERTDLQQEREQLEQEQARLNDGLTQLEQQQQTWRQRQDAEEARLHQWADQLGEFEQSLRDEQENGSEAQQDLSQLESLETTNQLLLSQLDEVQKQHATETEQWRLEKADQEAKFAELSQQITQFEALSRQVAGFEAAAQEREQLQQEVVNLQAELQAKQEMQDQLAREVQTLRNQMDQAEEYCNKWEEQHQQMESDLAAARMANVEKDHEIEALRAKLSSTVQSPTGADAATATLVYDENYVEDQPVYQEQAHNPAHEQAGHEASYEQPAYDQSSYEQRGYDHAAQSGHEVGYEQQPVQQRPGFEQAGFEQAGFEQAGFEQAGFEQAGYEQQQPSYQEPIYENPEAQHAESEHQEFAHSLENHDAGESAMDPNAPLQTMTMDELAAIESHEAGQPSPDASAPMRTMTMDELAALGENEEAYGQAEQPQEAPVDQTMFFEYSEDDEEPQYEEPIFEDNGHDQTVQLGEHSSDATPGPQHAEDVTFSEPQGGAPVDTASILAQYGHSLPPDAADEFEDQGATVSLGEPSDSVAPGPPPSGGENEEDIQDYMAQLMKRVGGGEYQPSAVQPEPKSAPEPTQTVPVTPPTQKKKREKAASAGKEDAESTKLLDPSEFVPRAVAPEATGGLRALRAVANTSTRSAIDRHRKRRLGSNALFSIVLAVVAGIVCVSSGYLAISSGKIVSLPMLACMVSGFVGLLALIKALAFSARSKLGNKSRRQQNLKQLSAR